MTLNMLIILGAFLMTAISIDAKTDEAEIRMTIKQFSTAADRQDAARIGEVLHAEAQQFYKGADGLVRLETKTYLNLIEQKKIGGEARELHIKNVDVNGDMASVNAVMSGKDYTFDNYISLMKVDGSWQIMSIILRMAKK